MSSNSAEQRTGSGDLRMEGKRTLRIVCGDVCSGLCARDFLLPDAVAAARLLLLQLLASRHHRKTFRHKQHLFGTSLSEIFVALLARNATTTKHAATLNKLPFDEENVARKKRKNVREKQSSSLLVHFSLCFRFFSLVSHGAIFIHCFNVICTSRTTTAATRTRGKMETNG